MSKMNSRKQRGSVTIFLVLILVPMLLITSIFVDASKTNLTKAVVNSTADLTLNTALANYDTELKKLYGLFATEQDTDKLYDSLEEYFSAMITQSGLEESDATTFSKMIIRALKRSGGGSNYSDFLMMEFMEEAKITKVDQGSLTNPVVLEQQIVDFMKYRSPINTGLGFIQALKSFQTLEKQKDLINKRKEYYEKQEEMMNYLRLAWINILKYQNLDITEKLVHDIADYANGEGDFAGEGIKDKYTFSNMRYFSDISSRKRFYDIYKMDGESFSVIGIGGESSSPISETYGGALSAEMIKSAVKQFENAYDDAYGKTDGGSFKLPAGTSGDAKSQLWLQNNYDGSYKEFGEAARRVFDAYSTLNGIQGSIDKMRTDPESDPDGKIQQDKAKFQAALGDLSSYEGKFNTISNAVNSVYSQLEPFRKYYIDTAIGSYLPEIKTEIKEINETLHEFYDEHLIKAIKENERKEGNYLSKAIEYLNKAFKASKGLNQKREEWSQAANNPVIKDTTLATQDRAEIAHLGEMLTQESVSKLVTRLMRVYEELTKVREEIEKFEYCDSKVYSMTFESFASSLEGNYSGNLEKLPLSYGEIKNISDAFFTSQFKEGKIEWKWAAEDASNPELTKGEQTGLYTYLSKQFGTEIDTSGNSEELPKDYKKEFEDLTKDNNDEKDGSGLQTSGGSVSKIPRITSAGTVAGTSASSDPHSATKSKTVTSSSLFADLASMSATFRDNLYISDYVNSMLSFSTIEKEAEDKKKSKTDEEDRGIKTLTQEDINAENNKIYPNEVEYVIFGGSNSSNVNAACASIYGIRLAFNLVSAFSIAEVVNEAAVIAAALSAASLGVIPQPLIQCVIIIAAACIESGIDLAELKEGKAVVLFKTNQTFNTTVSGLGKSIAKKGASTVVDLGSEILIEILNSTDEEAEKLIGEYKEKIEEYLDQTFNNMSENIAMVGINTMYSAAQDGWAEGLLKEYDGEELKAFIRKQIDESLQKWANSGGSSPLEAQLKSIAYGILTDYVDNFVEAVMSGEGNGDMSVGLNNVMTACRRRISDAVNDAGSAISGYREDFKNSIIEACRNGADNLKKTIDEKLSMFGDGSSNNGNAAQSLLSFRYSDYLRFFLMVGLYTCHDGILYRTGDLLQTNMLIKNSKFELNKSSAYVKIEGEIKANPLLLSLQLFSDKTEDVLSDTSWYQYHFEKVKGY